MTNACKVILFLLATSFIFAGNIMAQLSPADLQDATVKTDTQEVPSSVTNEELTNKPITQPSKDYPVISADTLPISYNAKDSGDAGLKEIELYYTNDEGKTWKFYGNDPDLKSPLEFKAEQDDLYGFITVATDNVGNTEPKPTPGTLPHVSVIIDREFPQVKILAPNDGDIFNVTDKQQIRWSALDTNLGPNPITLKYSIDGGKIWHDIQTKIPNTGEYQWTPPKESTLNCLVKVLAIDKASNMTTEKSNNFIIDGIAPKTLLSSIETISSKEFDIKFETSDEGGSGMREVELWYQIEDGEWTKQDSYTNMDSPIKLTAPGEGSVNLCLVGFDKVGNHEESPDKRTDLASSIKSIDIDFTPPKVALLNFHGDEVVQGGSHQTLNWEAEDVNLAEKPVSLSFSLDNGTTWEDIARNVANTGSLEWEIPNKDSHSALVRLSVVDNMDNESSTQSKSVFTVDSTAPASRAFFINELLSTSSKEPITIVQSSENEDEDKTEPSKQEEPE